MSLDYQDARTGAATVRAGARPVRRRSPRHPNALPSVDLLGAYAFIDDRVPPNVTVLGHGFVERLQIWH